MYKLLIIDDEKLIREGLVDYIDWSSLNISVIGSAKDGQEALDLIKQNRPDIVLSDICMPQLDGISLIESIRKLELKTQVVFISAYSNFQYAQSALKYGAFDYLLKPLEEDVLYECMKKCTAKLESITVYPDDFKKIRSRLLQKYFLEYLTANVPFCEEAVQLTKQLLGEGVWENFNMLTVYLNNTDFLQSAPKFFSSVKGLRVYHITISDQMHIYLLFSACTESESVLHLFDEKFLNNDFLYAFTNCNLQTMPLSWNESQLTLLKQIGFSVFSKTSWSDFVPNRNTIQLALYSTDGHALQDLLQQQLYLLMNQNSIYDISKVQHQLKSLLYSIYEELQHANNLPPENSSLQLTGIISALTGCLNTFEVFNFIKVVFGKLEKFILKSASSNKLVTMTLQYIHQNFASPISLYGISQEMHVSPSYLSKLFKTITGCTFSEYLIRYRIEEAQFLFQQDHLKIYEAAQLVGYSDVVQFTKMFKKVTGVSPSKWIDMH